MTDETKATGTASEAGTADAERQLDGAREKLAEELAEVETTLSGSGEGVARAKQQVRETARKASDAAREKAQQARETARETAQKASVAARETAQKASVAAREQYDSTVQNLRVGYDRVQKDMTQLSRDVNDYVQDNPGKSVLMAAGAGFVLGLLLRGGRSRD